MTQREAGYKFNRIQLVSFCDCLLFLSVLQPESRGFGYPHPPQFP